MVRILFPFRGRAQSEQGFSLISVLVIMSIVLVAVLMITQSRVNQQTAQKAIKIKQSYTDVNQALVSDLVRHLHTQLTANAPCINLALININMNGVNVVDPAAPAYVFSEAIPVANTSPSVHTQARDRCADSRVPTNGASNLDNKAYFCLRLGRDAASPRDSILNAELAFAEVAIDLIDLQTQLPISCATYASRKVDPNDGSAGMAVTMGLYWQSMVSGRLTYSQKALSYVANQN